MSMQMKPSTNFSKMHESQFEYLWMVILAQAHVRGGAAGGGGV